MTAKILLLLRETHKALQLPVFFFSFFCQLCLEYQSQPYPGFWPCHNRKNHICCHSIRKGIWPFQRTTQASGQGCPGKKAVSDFLWWSAKIKNSFLFNYSSIYLFYLSLCFVSPGFSLEKNCLWSWVAQHKNIQTFNFIFINN